MTRSSGWLSGATTCTASPRARSDAATSRPMKLAPTTTTRLRRAPPWRQWRGCPRTCAGSGSANRRRPGCPGGQGPHRSRSVERRTHTSCRSRARPASVRHRATTPAHSARDRSAARCSTRGIAAESSPRRRVPARKSFDRFGRSFGRKSSALIMRQRTVVPFPAQHVRGGQAGGASTDDHHRSRRRGATRGRRRGASGSASCLLLPDVDRVADTLDAPAGDRIERRRPQRFAGAKAETGVMHRTSHACRRRSGRRPAGRDSACRTRRRRKRASPWRTSSTSSPSTRPSTLPLSGRLRSEIRF